MDVGKERKISSEMKQVVNRSSTQLDLSTGIALESLYGFAFRMIKNGMY